jgi:septal ring factor EnvC (AmiA/AmiB activator)
MAIGTAAPARLMADDREKRDAISLARDRLDAARTEATELSDKISAAQSEQAQLEAEIAEAERTVPALRARADLLRLAMKQRAIELYVGHDQRIDALLQTDSVIDGARAAQLTGSIATHDRDLAAELRATAQQVEAPAGTARGSSAPTRSRTTTRTSRTTRAATASSPRVMSSATWG